MVIRPRQQWTNQSKEATGLTGGDPTTQAPYASCGRVVIQETNTDFPPIPLPQLRLVGRSGKRRQTRLRPIPLPPATLPGRIGQRRQPTTPPISTSTATLPGREDWSTEGRPDSSIPFHSYALEELVNEEDNRKPPADPLPPATLPLGKIRQQDNTNPYDPLPPDLRFLGRLVNQGPHDSRRSLLPLGSWESSTVADPSTNWADG